METSKSEGNIRVLASASFLSGLYSSMVQAIWQPFVLSLGAPMSTLGLLESLGGWKGLVTGLVQLLGGWLSDRLGRKPLMAFASLMGIAASLFYIFAALLVDWHLLVPGVILLSSARLSHPATISITAESTEKRTRGRAYSLLMFSGMAPGVFAPALGGFIADRWSFISVFLLRVALGGICLFVVLRFLKETLHQGAGSLQLGKLRRVLRGAIVPPKGLRGFYVAMAADAFVWGMGSRLLFGLLNETYGFTTYQLGVMSSLFSLSCALSQLPIGKLVDRYGCKPFLILSEGIGIFVVTGWLVSTSYVAFAILQIFMGLVAATWTPALLTLVADSVSMERRAEAMGRLSAFRGLVAFPSPYIGGLIYELVGFRGPIFANLVGAVATLILIGLLVHEPHSRGGVPWSEVVKVRSTDNGA